MANNPEPFELDDDSFADLPMAPALPGISAAFIGTPIRSTSASKSGQPSLSPDILAAKVRVAELRQHLNSTPPLEPSNADLMTVILGMREQMALKADIEVAKLETVKEIRAELAPIRAHVAEVETKANQALTETKVLHDRMISAEEATRIDSLRIAQLESGIRNLEARLAATGLSFKRDKFDPALQRIRFVGWPASTPSKNKRAAIEALLQQHCPDMKPIHVGDFGEKASFAHFGTPREMKAALEKLKGKHMASFADVKVSAALTSIDTSRNTSLYKAEEMIKADPKSISRNIEMKRTTGRGIYVDSVPAFLQNDRHDPKGTFEGEFQHLKFT